MWLHQKARDFLSPSEMVLDILDSQNLGYFAKEDGEVIIDEQGRRLK